MHSRTPDESYEVTRRCSRETDHHHEPGYLSTVPPLSADLPCKSPAGQWMTKLTANSKHSHQTSSGSVISLASPHGRAWSMLRLSSTSSLERSSAPSRRVWLCQIACRSMGRVSTSMTTAFVLDALNQAICQRGPEKGGGLIHHSPSRDHAAHNPAGQWSADLNIYP